MEPQEQKWRTFSVDDGTRLCSELDSEESIIESSDLIRGPRGDGRSSEWGEMESDSILSCLTVSWRVNLYVERAVPLRSYHRFPDVLPFVLSRVGPQ